MNKPAQDRDNFEFTKRWVEQHLPFGLEQTTDVLYNDFFKALFESNLKYSPSIEAFRSQLRKLDFISSRPVKVERDKKIVCMKAWYKVEKIVEPDEPIKMSKDYPTVCEILRRSKRGIESWFK